MKMLEYFFGCYFNQSAYFDELDELIKNFKNTELDHYQIQFITELHQIIQTKNYELAAKIIDKYGDRTPNLSQTEQLIRYIYNRLIDQPTCLDMKDFVKDCKVVFCPICCPDQENPQMIILIQKAKIIGKDMQIFACKDCKHVWLTEDIRIDNAQDYKKFMKSLGLKGLWKELSDVDIL